MKSSTSPPARLQAHQAAFSTEERRLLLGTPRSGPAVVRRLEEAGFDSLAALQQAGIETVIWHLCLHGSPSLANRRRALEAAVAAAITNG